MKYRARARLRRYRYHAWGVVLIPLAPLLLPILAGLVYFGARRRAWQRAWWWYGYHGLYQIDWARKRRARIRAGTLGRCTSGKWMLEPESGKWIGVRCDRGELHRPGRCHFVPDWKWSS